MLSLRPGTRSDVPLILRLVRELATYERAPGAVVATEADFLRDGFGDTPRFHVLLGEWNGEPAGFALYFYNWSTWLGRAGLFLEALVVLPRHGGNGIGKALLRELARIAVREGCGRFQWQVLDWNELAPGFSSSLGAQVMPEWLTVPLEGDALRRLGKE